ncbi:hypothetical protein KAS42_02705 [bacterium]|nr:hypothetical protein [bacterium]
MTQAEDQNTGIDESVGQGYIIEFLTALATDLNEGEEFFQWSEIGSYQSECSLIYVRPQAIQLKKTYTLSKGFWGDLVSIFLPAGFTTVGRKEQIEEINRQNAETAIRIAKPHPYHSTLGKKEQPETQYVYQISARSPEGKVFVHVFTLEKDRAYQSLLKYEEAQRCLDLMVRSAVGPDAMREITQD